MSPKVFLVRTRLVGIIRTHAAGIALALCHLLPRGAAMLAASLEDYRGALARYLGALDANQIGPAIDKYTPRRNARSLVATPHNTFNSFLYWFQLSTATGWKA